VSGEQANPPAAGGREGEKELVPLQFGLAKPGAPEPFDGRWLNNNTRTRIEKFEEWPWKIPFQQHCCIVPLSEFREPCYWGETAGSEVYFKAVDADYLGVASLYSVWTSPDGVPASSEPGELLRLDSWMPQHRQGYGPTGLAADRVGLPMFEHVPKNGCDPPHDGHAGDLTVLSRNRQDWPR
jgi:hypothetical protein